MEQVKNLLDNIALYKQNWEVANEARKFYNWLRRQESGEDLLSRYQLNLFQIHEVNTENARLTNFASTRMSRVQQNLNEEYLVFTELCDQLKSLPQMRNDLDEMNRRLKEIERFSIQTEIAMKCLESANSALMSKGV